MKRFLIILMASTLFALSGCGTTYVHHEFSPGTRIGLLLDMPAGDLCRDHTGVLVFGNNKQVIKSDIETDALIKNSFKTLARANGHTAIEINDPDANENVRHYFDFSSWDLYPTVKPQMAEPLQALLARHNVDVAVFFSFDPNSADAKSDPEKLNCRFRYSTDARFKYGVVRSKPHFVGFVADTLEPLKSNEGIGGAPVYDVDPRGKNGLTSAQMDAVIEHIAVGIENGIRDFFQTNGLGEDDYRERQHGAP